MDLVRDDKCLVHKSELHSRWKSFLYLNWGLFCRRCNSWVRAVVVEWDVVVKWDSSCGWDIMVELVVWIQWALLIKRDVSVEWDVSVKRSLSFEWDASVK